MQGFCASTFAKKQKDDPTLAVSILTAGPWPIQSNDMYNPPVEILEVCEKIIGYYLGTCTGMRLYWQTNMGTDDLRTTYGRDQQEDLMGLPQLKWMILALVVVLVLLPLLQCQIFSGRSDFDFITEQVKDAQVMETILETTPLYMLSLFLVFKVCALAG